MRVVPLVLAAAMLGGCAAGPPPASLRFASSAPTPPTPRGVGRVVLETEGEPATVTEVGPVERPLCTTPCVVDFPYGPHALALASTSDASHASEIDLDVGPRAKIVRHRLGERRDAGPLHGVGWGLLVLGAITTAAGAVLWSGAHEEHGPMAAGIGAGLVTLGLPLVLLDGPVERSGSTIEAPLDARR